ncbi:MAG: hypothetical protein ACK46X_03630 [Candidatus Sericytochromatia bacterium]
MPKTPMRRLALLGGGVALVGASACRLDVAPPATSGAQPAGATYTVQQIPPAGRKGTAVRRFFCDTWQCASAGDKAWCMRRCVNVWDFPTAQSPIIPGPGTTQRVYHFTGGIEDRGVLGVIRLQPGLRTFRGTHTGDGNFILYLTSTRPQSGPDVVFNELGPGTWTWTTRITRPGDYELDMKFADTAWTVTVE